MGRYRIAVGLAVAALAAGGPAFAATYSGAGFNVPDNTPAGAASTVMVADSGLVQDLDLTIFGLKHPWMGDLIGRLSHGGVTVTFLESDWNNSDDLNGDYTFAKTGLDPQYFQRGVPRVPGTYISRGDLSAFKGLSAAGAWTLTFVDQGRSDLGSFTGWSLNLSTLAAPPPNGAVPEPATWAMMILGFAAVGATLRRRQPARA